MVRPSVAARSIIAHAPTRLDFGGGWTDVPPYPEDRGGFVCNLAIERRATVRLSTSTGAVHSAAGIDLIAAACAAANVSDARVELSSDFPVGAGLGGSSAAGVALAAALARWRGLHVSPAQLALESREVEVAGLGMAGGFQDHYAAAFGGALALSFGKEIQVERIPLSAAAVAELETRCLLFYTGESRISGDTITAVLDGYKHRTPHVVNALERMKALAMQMSEALKAGDVDTLGALLGEHWQFQRSLHPRITTEKIDGIARVAAEHGALGIKALGASGGGCVVVIAPRDGTERVAHAIAGLAERLTWRIAHNGVEVSEEMPLSSARVEG
ncbi:MAG: hypothetical protein H7Z40_18220 [Phycisphaerae bacterium]|nr:hypothetical protein [Gemmatimonadaceae bacterium]